MGRSRAAWHTSFIIPELNLLLDAGLFISDKHRPKHIFITHGHSDHTLVVAGFTNREDPPDVVCPHAVCRVLDDYVLAKTMMNRGGLVRTEDAEKAGLLDDGDEEEDGQEEGKKTNGRKKKPTPKIEIPHMPYREHRTPGERAFLNTHFTHALSPGETIPLRRLPQISATAFACDHNVPSIGYLFARTSNKLAPEYASLPPAELKALRLSGVEITKPHTTPLFAFLGDGTASTLQASPQWLQDGVPMVITECSFLREDHRAQAAKTKHTIWGDLEGVVRRWKDTVFVLTHFSMRYSEGEVVRFFKEMEDCPKNIVVWADPAAA